MNKKNGYINWLSVFSMILSLVLVNNYNWLGIIFLIGLTSVQVLVCKDVLSSCLTGNHHINHYQTRLEVYQLFLFHCFLSDVFSQAMRLYLLNPYGWSKSYLIFDDTLIHIYGFLTNDKDICS